MATRLCDPDKVSVYSVHKLSPAIDRLAANQSVLWYLSEDGDIVVDPVPLALLQYPDFDSTMEIPKDLYTVIVTAVQILKNAALHDER